MTRGSRIAGAVFVVLSLPWSPVPAADTEDSDSKAYEAWTQWYPAPLNSDHLACMVPLVAPSQPFKNFPYENGVLFGWAPRWMLWMDGRTMQTADWPMSEPELLTPGEIYEYTIELWPSGNLFREGHRIRLDVASAAFPLFLRNLNTGANNQTTSEIVVATQTIHHDAEHPSHLILPIVPPEGDRQ